MSIPRRAICTFCDDIRQEIGNKTSYMGAYHGDMIFSVPPPVVLPKLCAVVSLISDPDDRPTKFEVTVINTDGEGIYKNALPTIGEFRHMEGALTAVFRMWFILPPILLKQPGTIEVWAQTEREKIRAGRLFVSFNPPQSAQTAATPS